VPRYAGSGCVCNVVLLALANEYVASGRVESQHHTEIPNIRTAVSKGFDISVLNDVDHSDCGSDVLIV